MPSRDHPDITQISRLTPVFLLIAFAGFSLACMAATRIVSPAAPTPTPAATLTPAPSSTPAACADGNCILACVDKLGAIVHPQNKKTPRQAFANSQEYTLVTYHIDGNQIDNPVLGQGLPASIKRYQADRSTQTEIWDYFSAIIPLDRRTFLAHYVIFTDGPDNDLAAVVQSDSSPQEWDLSVDILDTSDPRDLTYTLIHEFGHLLTLNPDQVIPSQAIFDNPQNDSVYQKEEQACPNYFPGEGCSRKNSYINHFVGRFWGKIYDEWLAIDNIENDDVYYNRLDAFYKKYKQQFVTDYAPTSPEEDIAESWTYFILKPKPTGNSIADQKVLFFYEFPELIDLRGQIARNLCNQLEK